MRTNRLLSMITKHPLVLLSAAVFGLFPVIIKSDYLLRVVMEIFFFAAMGTAWNIIGGFGRQTSWASAAFFGMGAYTSMLLYLRLGISPWIGMLATMVMTVALAVVIGMPCFRMRGVYFAIATIACTTIFRQLLIHLRDFTGGTLGLSLGVRLKETLWHLSYNEEWKYYYIALIWLIISITIVVFINRSKLGFYLKAIREDEDAAESLGMKSHQIKMVSYIISAMMLGITGVLYAFKGGYIDPNMVASHDISVRIGVVAILGGMGTIWGPTLGAFITVPMLEICNYYFSGISGGGLGFAIYGLLIILVVLLRPDGLISLFDKHRIRRAAKKPAKEESKL